MIIKKKSLEHERDTDKWDREGESRKEKGMEEWERYDKLRERKGSTKNIKIHYKR